MEGPLFFEVGGFIGGLYIKIQQVECIYTPPIFASTLFIARRERRRIAEAYTACLLPSETGVFLFDSPSFLHWDFFPFLYLLPA